MGVDPWNRFGMAADLNNSRSYKLFAINVGVILQTELKISTKVHVSDVSDVTIDY